VFEAQGKEIQPGKPSIPGSAMLVSGERAPKTDCLRDAEADSRVDRAGNTGNTALLGRLWAVGRRRRKPPPRRARAARAEA